LYRQPRPARILRSVFPAWPEIAAHGWFLPFFTVDREKRQKLTKVNVHLRNLSKLP